MSKGTSFKRIVWLSLAAWLCLAVTPTFAQTRVALVSTCGGEAGQNMLALAEAKLSTEKDIALVERTLVERVLDEQKLTRCGLSDSAQALAVGKLLGVQVFATLETFPGSQEALGLVAFDARSGAKLWDATLPEGGVDKRAEGIVTAVHDACRKRLQPAAGIRTVCLLSVRNAELPHAMDSICESVGAMLERRLVGSASLTVLERERLEQINRERALPTNDFANDLLASLTVLELEFSRGSESNGVKVAVFLTDASGASLGKVQAVGDTEGVTDLVELLFQKLIRSLNAAPALATVDRPREAQRFRQEATFFIEHMQFAKGLQAAEAAYALNPADKELRALLTDALLKVANDLLAPGQPELHSWASKTLPDNLKRALGLAHRGANLCLEIRAGMPSVNIPRVGSSKEEQAFEYFLKRVRNIKEGYDDESRRQFAELQAKYRRILVEFWERPAFAGNTEGANAYFICCPPDDFYWFINWFEYGSATSAGWTADAVEILDHWLALLDKHGLCNVQTETVNWMLSPIVYRIREPSKMYGGCHGQCWSLTEADLAQLQVFFDSLRHRQEPLFQLYAMVSEFAAVVRKEQGQGEAVNSQLAQIKNLGKRIISNPPCEKSDGYRVAVYQALLDTIDLLPDPAMRRGEYQELFDFMVERREYVHWVAMAAVDPQSEIYAAYQYMESVFSYIAGEVLSKGDPKVCARNLERLLAMLDSPDCRRLSEPPPSWRGQLDQQLAQLRESLAIQEPGLKLQTLTPWSAARLLYDGPSALLQPRVVGNAVWGLEFPPGKTSASKLRLVRVPLDGSPAQRYDKVPLDGPPDGFYATTVNDGIVIFPADSAPVNHFTETNGLPSSHVSVVACCDGKLYAGIGENTGYQGTAGYLIVCELATGRVTVLASSMRKEKLSALDNVSPPFFVRQMIADPARHRVLFSVDIGEYKGGTPYSGLWSVGTKDDKLTYLLPLAGFCEWMSQIRNEEVLLARRLRLTSGVAYEVLSFNLETNKTKIWATPWPEGDQAFVRGDHVYKTSWESYSPHLILDGWLWVAWPFQRIPADGGPREFLPSFAEGGPFGYGQLNYLEPLENGRRILAGVGNQLWLLDLKPTTPAVADDASKVSP